MANHLNVVVTLRALGILLALTGLAIFAACRRPVKPPDPPTPVDPPTPPLRDVSPTPTSSPQATHTPTSSPEGPGNADVTHVRAVQGADGSWTFHVTVAHPDTGWDDYADGWDVVTPEGVVLKPDPSSPFTRLLLHPHENEQPFTRSQSGILIPEGVTRVQVRAHDLVDGYGGREVLVDLDVTSGPDYEVERRSTD
jgi:hypothetical protein